MAITLRIIPSLLILALPFVAKSNDNRSLYNYHGESKRKIVSVQLADSLAIVEYCHANISGTWQTDIDTLKRSDNKYKGSLTEIEVQHENLIFKPGNIKLRSGVPDISYNSSRNLGYTRYLDKKIKKALTWTAADLSEFGLTKWSMDSLLRLDIDAFRRLVINGYDSLYSYCISESYTSKFGKLVVKDYRLFPKKYMVTSNNAEIFKFWQMLSKGSAQNRNIFAYLIQMPILFAVVNVIDFDVALMAFPFTYPALIGTEIFIGNRILAKSTFKVIFYSAIHGKRQCVLKIRKSRIVCQQYTYILPFDFKTLLVSK